MTLAFFGTCTRGLHTVKKLQITALSSIHTERLLKQQCIMGFIIMFSHKRLRRHVNHPALRRTSASSTIHLASPTFTSALYRGKLIEESSNSCVCYGGSSSSCCNSNCCSSSATNMRCCRLVTVLVFGLASRSSNRDGHAHTCV